jgi:hypothetical protein
MLCQSKGPSTDEFFSSNYFHIKAAECCILAKRDSSTSISLAESDIVKGTVGQVEEESL